MIINSDDQIKEIFAQAKTIAVVGCSSDVFKTSHLIPKYMKNSGYKVIPINPSADEIFGEKVYKSLNEITEHIDIVSVFRPSEEAVDIVKESVSHKPKVIWMQSGIESKDAANIAEQHGIDVIMNRCIKVEYSRLM